MLVVKSFNDYDITKKFDLVFLDGNHNNGQPLKDVKKLMSSLDCPLLLHDTWMQDVQKASQYLKESGYNEFIFNTQSRLAYYCKGDLPEWINSIVA